MSDYPCRPGRSAFGLFFQRNRRTKSRKTIACEAAAQKGTRKHFFPQKTSKTYMPGAGICSRLGAKNEKKHIAENIFWKRCNPAK
ncbi:MAG: hypothetical protein D6714_19140, partial [Bacteroidetes bacterium]